jgi:hypothetical protein
MEPGGGASPRPLGRHDAAERLYALAWCRWRHAQDLLLHRPERERP